MIAYKTLFCFAILSLSVLATAQGEQPAARLAARQAQPTQAMARRADCSGIGQCVDGSSNVNTSGMVVNFSDDSSSSSTSSPSPDATQSTASDQASSASSSPSSTSMGSMDSAPTTSSAQACLAAAVVASLMGVFIL